MKTKLFSVCFGLSVLFVSLSSACAAGNSAVKPAHRHNWWTLRHQAVNERVKHGKVDLIFIGDSIVHGWEKGGRQTWHDFYDHRRTVNMGFSGDRTQHVLWRLDHGNINGISPRAAVVMIGTNNMSRNTAEGTADGIIAVCKKLRAKLPKTKILLLAVFPRDPQPSKLRDKVAETNKLASKIADGKMIHYLDIGPKFLQPDKSISSELMYDYLHPTPRGYRIWAEAIEEKLAELMGENK